MNGGGEDAEVGIPADSEVPRIRLRRIRPDGDALVLLAVSVEEVGLSAAITVNTLNGDGLDDFFAGLDKDFRGWPGGRHWKSHEGDLELEAVHTGRTILLAWTLRFPPEALDLRTGAIAARLLGSGRDGARFECGCRPNAG